MNRIFVLLFTVAVLLTTPACGPNTHNEKVEATELVKQAKRITLAHFKYGRDLKAVLKQHVDSVRSAFYAAHGGNQGPLAAASPLQPADTVLIDKYNLMLTDYILADNAACAAELSYRKQLAAEKIPISEFEAWYDSTMANKPDIDKTLNAMRDSLQRASHKLNNVRPNS